VSDCTTPFQSPGGVREQIEDLDGARLLLKKTRLDLGAGLLGGFDVRDARHEEGPAFEELQHAEAHLVPAR